jgi:hypothetical protein
MGKPYKRPEIPYEEVERTIRQASQLAAPDYMPKHPEILGQITIALTERIHDLLSPAEYRLWLLIDVPVPPDVDRLVLITRVMLDRTKERRTDEYNHCRSVIAGIAMVEVVSREDHSAKEKADEISKMLTELAYHEASRLSHIPSNVAIQREMLISYLETEQYLKAKNPGNWVKHHWPSLMTFLTAIPCRCSHKQQSNLQQNFHPADG